jgi:membrane protein required for colicin V production
MDTASFALSSNPVDIVILVIFVLSIIIGFGRGLISEILSLITLIAAFIVGIIFTNSFAAYLASTPAMQSMVNSTSTASGTSTAEPASYMLFAASFAILFIITYIIGSVVKLLLNMMFTPGVIGFINRLLGGIFGVVRGYLLNLALILLIQLSPFSASAQWQASKYVPMFQPQVAWLANVISPKLADLKKTFSSAVESVSDKAKAAASDAAKKSKPDNS